MVRPRRVDRHVTNRYTSSPGSTRAKMILFRLAGKFSPTALTSLDVIGSAQMTIHWNSVIICKKSLIFTVRRFAIFKTAGSHYAKEDHLSYCFLDRLRFI